MELDPGFYSSPRWSTELLDCAMPMSFDTYDNCAFNCTYCFSFFQRAIGDGAQDYLHHKVRAVNVEGIKEMFLGKRPKSSFNWYIQKKMVMQWGGLSDGFDYYEKKFGKSLELLKFFREIQYPLSISTKGTWFVYDPRYREQLQGADHIHFKLSIITLDPDKARKMEKGVSTPEERFKAIEELNKLGVGGTTARFRPFILGVSAAFPFSDRSKSDIENYVIRAKDAGCGSITTEFLCLETRSANTASERYAEIGQIAGLDIWGMYRKYSQARSGLLRLSYDIKRPYIDTMHELCDKHGMDFFVSDQHHKEQCCWTGCCGLPNKAPFTNVNYGQYAHALLIAKEKGSVRWSDIAHLAEGMKNMTFSGAEGFNSGGTRQRAQRMYQTMFDFMRDTWNNPGAGQSPAKYFGGVLVPDAPDENGDIVYLYNKPYVETGARVGSVAELRSYLGLGEGSRQSVLPDPEEGECCADIVGDQASLI